MGRRKQGAFFESLNLAAVWKLPIVYILENNQYQAYTHISLEDANCIAGDPLSQKAEAFSIPGVTVDGTDPLKVYAAVAKAADRARGGKGPSLIEVEVLSLQRARQRHHRAPSADAVSGARSRRSVWQESGVRMLRRKRSHSAFPRRACCARA